MNYVYLLFQRFYRGIWPTSLRCFHLQSRTTEYLRINVQLFVSGCAGGVSCSVVYRGSRVEAADATFDLLCFVQDIRPLTLSGAS